MMTHIKHAAIILAVVAIANRIGFVKSIVYGDGSPLI